MPTLVFNDGVHFDREALLQKFKEANIDGRVFFWPLSVLGVAGVPTEANTPVAHCISPRAINLPSYHDMGQAEVLRVAKILLAVHGK